MEVIESQKNNKKNKQTNNFNKGWLKHLIEKLVQTNKKYRAWF